MLLDVISEKFIKHLPLSLSVSDLHSHATTEKQRNELDTVPALILLTGNRAVVYTLGNWNSPKKAVVVRPLQFTKGKAPSGGAEVEDGYFLLRSYTHLVTYSLRQSRYHAKDSTCIEAAGDLTDYVSEYLFKHVQPCFQLVHTFVQ